MHTECISLPQQRRYKILHPSRAPHADLLRLFPVPGISNGSISWTFCRRVVLLWAAFYHGQGTETFHRYLEYLKTYFISKREHHVRQTLLGITRTEVHKIDCHPFSIVGRNLYERQPQKVIQLLSTETLNTGSSTATTEHTVTQHATTNSTARGKSLKPLSGQNVVYSKLLTFVNGRFPRVYHIHEIMNRLVAGAQSTRIFILALGTCLYECGVSSR